MTLKRLEIFVIVTIIAGIGIVYALTRQPVSAPTTNSIEEQQVSNGVEYHGIDGRTAMDILKSQYQAEVKSFSFGEMVTGINGVKPDDKHFWAMYVNGEMSQVGASEYVTKNSDIIRWQLDEIKF